MRGIGTLLSAVSVGITDGAGKLYLLGIIFVDFCPVRPVLRSGSIADRGKGISLFCLVSVSFRGGFNAPVHAFSVGSARRGAFRERLLFMVCNSRTRSLFARYSL